MIENLPSYVSWIFAFTTLVTVTLYLYAVRGVSRQSAFLTGAVLAVLLGLHAILAVNDFYIARVNPPRFPLAVVPTTVILLMLFFASARQGVPVSTLRVLTLLSVVRVLVELVLLWLYHHG